MSIKKIDNFNIHENPSTNENAFDIENYLNANFIKAKEVTNNNADELIEVQQNTTINTEQIEDIKQMNTTQEEQIEQLKVYI